MKLSLFLHGRTGAVPERIRQLADEVVEGDRLSQAFSLCSGDWIFALGADRTVSARWDRSLFDRLASQRALTHYFFPERFLLDEDHFAATAPYVGRFALGFLRNIESIAAPSNDPERELVLAGEAAYLAAPFLDGAASHPGPGVERLPVDDPQDVKIMARTHDRPSGGVRMRFIRTPAVMTAGRTYWVTVRISNDGTRALLPQSEFVYKGNLGLTYRWLEAPGPTAPAVPFPARILPGFEHDALLAVRAPETRGVLRLQADIVEENERYFSAFETGTYDASPIEVAAHG